MRSNDKERGVVLAGEEFERVETVRGVGVEGVDGILFGEVYGVGGFEGGLEARASTRGYKAIDQHPLDGVRGYEMLATYQILHRLPHILADLLSPHKDRRLGIFDHLRLASCEGSFDAGVFGFTVGIAIERLLLNIEAEG